MEAMGDNVGIRYIFHGLSGVPVEYIERLAGEVVLSRRLSESFCLIFALLLLLFLFSLRALLISTLENLVGF